MGVIFPTSKVSKKWNSPDVDVILEAPGCHELMFGPCLRAPQAVETALARLLLLCVDVPSATLLSVAKVAPWLSVWGGVGTAMHTFLCS